MTEQTTFAKRRFVLRSIPHISTALLRGLIFCIVLAAMGRLCAYEFNWYDDALTIHHNPDLNPPTLSSIGHYWTDLTDLRSRAPLGLYIPLTYTFWAAEAKMAYLDQPDQFGIHLNPWIFHGGNLLLHALAAVVVFEILRLLLMNDIAAAIGALLFGLHPVQVETVGWVSGTKDLLCGLFMLLAIWNYLHYAMRGQRRQLYYILGIVAFLAAMLSKPAAIVTPLILLILDLLIIKRSARQIAEALVPWFILAVPCMISARLAQQAQQVSSVQIWQRPLVAMDALSFYIQKVLLPINLGTDYGRTPTSVLASRWIALAWVSPAILGGLLWLIRKRHPMFPAAGLIALAGVLPVLGLVPFLYQQYSTVADHYLYPVMFGVALGAAYLVCLRPTAIIMSISGVILLVLAGLSFHQARVWRTDLTLWQHTIDVNPRSILGWNNLGVDRYRFGDLNGAKDAFEQARDLRRDDAVTHDNLSLVYSALGRPDEAADELQQAIDLADRPSLSSWSAEQIAQARERLESLKRKASTTRSQSR